MLGGFITPMAALLGLLVLPLVAVYFLKLKRPRLQIPSLALWRSVLQDQRVNSPFQRFKRNILLFLQILLLLLLVFAAMQPFWRGHSDSVSRLPVLVDVSASMAALSGPGGASRLDEARRRLLALADDLPRGQEICLISFGRTARRLTDFTDNRQILREAIARLTVTDETSDVEDAIRMVQALARRDRIDEVLLLSDGNLPARVNADLSFRIRYLRIEQGGPNIGITALGAQRSSDGAWELLVEVESSTAAESGANVVLLRNDERVAEDHVNVAATHGRRFLLRVDGSEPATAKVVLSPDGFDSLASDNQASIRLPAQRVLSAYVPHRLHTFRKVLKGISGVAVLPEKEGDAAAGDGYDLLITDRETDLAIPAVTVLSLGFVPPALQTLATIQQGQTQVVDWRRDAPLLQHVELGDLVILDQPRTATGVTESDFENAGYEVIAQGNAGPLILQQRQDKALRLAVLFNPDRSTLPYRVGFPILAANVVRATLDIQGLAEVHGAGGLLSASETSLASVEELELNEKLTVTASDKDFRTDRALWRMLATLALLVCLVEWWYFTRRNG